jgi:hypothetical protein
MQLLEIEVVGFLDRAARYAVLHRARQLADARGLRVMGFAVVHHVRLLLEHDDRAEEHVVVKALGRALKTSMTQASATAAVDARDAAVYPVADPVEALIDLHRRAVWNGDPLSTPWSSHRDLMGHRTAPFFDAGVWEGRVDPMVVHRACGGAEAMPTVPRTDLDHLFRTAAAVLGVLPSDPCTFGLFSQLARWAGRRHDEIAAALLVTPRRVRQLLERPVPELGMAIVSVGDRRLAVVP